MGPGHADRRGPSEPADGAAPRAASRTRSCWRSHRPTPAGTTAPRARTHGRSDHEIALDFVADLRGAPATEAESALLLDACDGCCHDPDLDTLVSTGSGG